jgi:hypothetical protein
VVLFLTQFNIPLFSQETQSHTGSIRGQLQDSLLNKTCQLAVVALLHPDSTLVQFTRTKIDGRWFFYGVPTGQYLLLISHPSYADFLARLEIKSNSMTDLGTLFLEPKADSLSPVIVTPRNPPVHMRGDTLEFNTANIKLKINATVEEMLSRLPGVVIDENGGIFVNGKKVERLLVDGEDFFSSDPTIVTKNFNADMIAKVQVLDKKSSQAEFTGIEDGQRTKTVNLVLKDDAKRGYFVKGELGDDPRSYYNTNGLLGAFEGHRQFAGLGLAANNGATGLGGGADVGGGLDLGAGDLNALGARSGGGVPQMEAAGTHYADKWNGNEDHVSGNAAMGHLISRPFSSSVIQQTLPDSLYIQSQNSKSVNRSSQQTLNADYDYLPDSLSAFRFSLGGTKVTGQDQYSSAGSSSFNDTLVNSSQNSIRAVVDNQNFNGNIMWRLRARKKKARNISITAGISTLNNITSGYLYAVNQFYPSNGALLTADTTDQRKVISTSGILINNSLNYTQPLWTKSILEFSDGLSFNRSASRQSTYGRGDGKYQDYIDSLSNYYQNDVVTQKITLNMQGKRSHINYTIGGDILQYSNRQTDLVIDSVLKYRYITFAPRANFNFDFNKVEAVSFTYSASTQQPSITQLQPVQNNNDPLHVTIGNPDLRPSFSQDFSVSYSSSRVINYNIGMSFSIADNGISTKTFTDSLGRQISQAVNVPETQSGAMNLSMSHKLKSIGIDLGGDADFSINRNLNYVSNLLNVNDTYNGKSSVSIGKYVTNVYNFQIRSAVIYTFVRSSINTAAPTAFWGQSHNAQLSYFPLAGLEVNTNVNYNWREKTNIFDKNNSTLLWNAYVSKSLLQNRLLLCWRINDILGQNAGINRSISGNTITQTSSNIIGRYWMLSATYRFERHGSLKK